MNPMHKAIWDPTSPVSTLYNIYMPNFFHISEYDPRDFELRKTAYHAHNYWQIFYINSGYIMHTVFNSTFKQERGSFVIIPPFCKHQVDTLFHASNVLQIEFSNDFMKYTLPKGGDEELFFSVYMEPLANNVKTKNPLILFEYQDTLRKAEDLLDSLKNEYSSLNRQTNIQMLFFNLLSLILNKYTSSASDIEANDVFKRYRSNIHGVLKYIDENFSRPINSDKIYRVATMSSSSFSYIFKSVTGMTLIDYINHVRITKAQSLLLSSDMPITNVAIDCGFKNLVTFDRIFKRIAGISPSAFAARKAEILKSSNVVIPEYHFEPVEKYIELAKTIDFM